MMYRRLDADFDYTFGNGKGNHLTGRAAVAQAIRTRLLLFQGEWWADLNDGLPLFQSIMGYQGANKEAVDRLILQRIAGTQGVTGVKFFSSSYNTGTRGYTFTATADTIYGEVAVSNVPFAT